MHRTLEDVQVGATPAVLGPIRVYFVLAALLLTSTTTKVGVYVVAIAIFSVLSTLAVGRTYFRLLGYLLSFLVPSLLIIAVFTGDAPVFQFWLIGVSERGSKVAVTTGLRAVASLSVVLFLALTTTVPELVAALDEIHLPDPIVEFLLLVYRGIQVLVEQAVRLHTAARLRGGFESRRTLFMTTKLVGSSLLLSSIDRAEAFENAMESRNYAGRMPVPEFENGGHALVAIVLVVLVATRWLA